MSTQRNTHAKNATAHPGAIVLASQGKQWTKAEKQADDEHVAAEQAAIEKAEQEHIITIAKMVMELRAKEQNAAAPEALGPGQASGAKGTSPSPNSTASSNRVAEQGNKHQMPSNVQVAATNLSAKPRKAKASLKAMISEASKTIADNASSNVTVVKPSHGLDKEPNLSQYLKKKSLSGTVKGWAMLVHEKTFPRGSPNPTSQGSSFSTLTSQATKVNTLATTTTQFSEIDAGITTKFGGFDLDSEGNGNEEQEMIPPKNGKGKSNDNTTLVVPSTPSTDSDSRSEIKASQIPPWYPPPTPRVRSARKRKMEAIVLVPDSEPEDDETAKSNMQIDTTGNMTHEIQTTTSMSVSVTHMEDAQPVSKRAKTEPAEETQVGVSTTMTSVDTVESRKTWTVGAKSKSRSDYKNSDLPILADHRWTNAFMDTVILWAGGQPSIWSISDETLATALQKIFAAVYPDIQYEVTIHSAVFGVAWQRLLEWHSGFGSTALIMVIHFFWEILKNNSEVEDSNATVREIARHLISSPHFPFTHEDCDDLDPARNFHSDFILKLVATAHLSKTLAAVNIQSLETAKLQKGYGMECVIALAAAALERAFTLVHDGIIDIWDAVKEMAEKKGKIMLLKTLNKATGNMSKGTSMFSLGNWGSEMQSYAISVTKKGPENTADIITSTYALLDHGPTHSGPSDANTVDPRALLWYFFRKLGLYYWN